MSCWISRTGLLRAARFAGALAAHWTVLLPAGFALVRLNDGKDQIFLTLKAAAGWDSNLFAGAVDESDTFWTVGATADYSRRAGIIGVDAALGVEVGRFETFTAENYVNPNARLEFTKASGRTTGSFLVSAARESRPDVAANVRARSWSYVSELKTRYQVIEKYSVATSLGYNRRDFLDNPLLVDLDTYTLSSDVYYAYTSQRDLFFGYRLRSERSARGTSFHDHALTAGLSGRITPKLNGTLRLGYQLRDESGFARDESHQGLTAAFSATWLVSERTSVTGQLTKDFATTSTNISNDSFAATLDAKRTLSRRYSVYGGIGYGMLDFLGLAGAGRNDTYATLAAGITRTIDERLAVTLGYAHLSNWSTLAAADYDRHTYTLSATARF